MDLIEIEDAIKNIVITDDVKNKISVGIDFGTTYCVISYIDKNGDIKFFGDKDGVLIPSVVAIHKTNEFVLVGQDAIRKIGNNDYAVIYSVKRLVAEQFSEMESKLIGQNISITDQGILVFNFKYTILDLVAFILTYIKGIAEKELEIKVDSAVITVPARFDDGARNIIKTASEAINLNVLRIINEPTAAGLGYGIDNDKEGIYAIYDFGGGTFDISILRMQMGVLQIISTCGDINLGGDDIDLILLNLISQKMNIKLGMHENKTKIQQIKHILSSENRAKIEINNIICEISLEQFEEAITPLIEKTIDIFNIALHDARKKEPDLLLHGIVLVGGSTRIPLVKYFLQNKFKVDIFSDLNPDTIVALGAAIKADSLNGGNNSDILIDIVPLSIGVEMMGGVVEKIIHRNTPIPVSVSQEFTTFKNNQTGIDLNIVQGEREIASDCRTLGKLLIRNIEPRIAGFIKILVNFKIDSDGILTVTAINQATKQEQFIEIKQSFGIEIEDMKKMLYDSINNAKTDIVKRLLLEAKTESEQLASSTKDALLKDGDLLDINEKILIEDCLQALENSCRNSIDRDEILLLNRTLEQSLSSFVEKRLNKYFTNKIIGTKI